VNLRKKESSTLVIIPAYNEAKNIVEIVLRASRFADVLVVDDGSSDDTSLVVTQSTTAKLIRLNRNSHIQRAIREGMKYAKAHSYDYCITMDAGGSHAPEELPLFLNSAACDLVVGQRIQKVNVPFFRRLISSMAAYLVPHLVKRKGHPGSMPTDVTSGYRRYSRLAFSTVLDSDMKSRSFGFHWEAYLLILASGLTVSSVQIQYRFSNSTFKFSNLLESIQVYLYYWMKLNLKF
jgi:dolichol-phosphate mannosyltransferase